MTTDDKILSLILLSYYSGERIQKVYDDVSALFAKENIPFELIIIDDGSKDDSYQIALRVEAEHGNVHAYQLSRNYGSMYGIFAGLSVCNGACALPIPDDEQQPYSSIVGMYRQWEKGAKIIVPHRITRDDPKLSAFFSRSYYALMNYISEIHYPEGGADIAMLDREVIDVVNSRIHPRNTMYIAEILNLGYSPCFYPYERPIGLNQGKSRWTFRKKVKLAKDTIFAASTFPVKCISAVGCWSCILSIIAFVLYFYIAAFGNRTFWGMTVPGWASLFLLILFFGGIIMLALGVVAEYMWRIYDEVKDKPGYIIKKKQC
ncbi:MAG: glycosyltransferase [Prevotellaceae bacterium]|nr:glycosyltransferase [Candidatus Faecinaster equi]